MIKLVVFDWNGTLIADTNLSVKATNECLKSLGEKALSVAQYRNYFDVPVSLLYENAGADTQKVRANSTMIQDVYHKCYEESELTLRTRSNVRTVLNWLKENDIPTAIFSNHTQDGVEKQTDRLGITKYFSIIIANPHKNSAIEGRNKEEKLKHYLNLNGIEPQDVLIVGDSTEEIEIAKALGTKVATITGGFCSTTRLKAAKPDYLIGDLGNLINIIREVNSS